jgi:hypothetical protein
MTLPLLPATINNNYKGYRFIEFTFVGIILVTFTRSFIHIFAPDGGAGIIAGVDLTVEGSSNIVSVFSLWGLSQLIIAILFAIVYIRYKSLIPLCYLILFIEYLGRFLIGLWKPLTSTHIPPGAIGNYIMIPLTSLLLLLSIKPPKKNIES